MLSLTTLILIALAALICEWIDSALGMGYGTILTPLLIIVGFPTSVVVPAILITQALGGISASIFHHKHGNADFNITPKTLLKKGLSEDIKVVLAIASFGVIATIIATFVGINISKIVLNTYIGFLVLIMGLFILLGFRFRYSTGKMVLVGIVSAFNKGLSGGGFGPIVTGGQIVLGQDHKKSIACTTAAEPLICITGFLSYLLLKGITGWNIILALGIGAVIAGTIGPLTTKKINKENLKRIVGILMLVLGIISLLKTFNILKLSIPLSI
jgi:uncharacterized membrane protein YfcA